MSRASIPIISGFSNMFDWGHQAVTIHLGSPSQKFHALLEISRPDTVIPSVSVEEESDDSDSFFEFEQHSYRYDDTQSSTGEKFGDEVIEYSLEEYTLSLEGYGTLETMSLGDIVVEKQPFCNLFSAKDRAGFFGAGEQQYYTRVGFSPNAASSSESTTYSGELRKPSIFQTMIDRGLLERNVIGLKPAWFKESDGVLNLGWIDSKYGNDAAGIPLSRFPDDVEKKIQSPWHVSVDSITVGDHSLKLEDHHVLFTTSTSYMMFPRDILASFKNELGAWGMGGALEDEEENEEGGRTLEDFPSITFSLGPQQTPVTIAPSVYTYNMMSYYNGEEDEDDDDDNDDDNENEDGDKDDGDDENEDGGKDEDKGDAKAKVKSETKAEEKPQYLWAPIGSFGDDDDDDDDNNEDDKDDGYPSKTIVLGTAFLRGFYTIFDADARTISFSPLERDASGGSQE